MCTGQHTAPFCVCANQHMVLFFCVNGSCVCSLANILSCLVCTSQFKVTSCMCALANTQPHLVGALTKIWSCFSVQRGPVFALANTLSCLVCAQANIWSCFYVCTSQHTVLSWMCSSQHSHCDITTTVTANWLVHSHPSLVTDCRLYQCSTAILLQSVSQRKISSTV